MRPRTFIAATLIAAALALGLTATASQAATEAAFTQAAFDAAQKADKPILVHIWASWCPTCKAQAPTLSKIEQDPKFARLTIFTVNFDTQKDAVKEFGARMQSTLIAFHGKAEQGRSVGDTHAESILALAAKAGE
jgi:thiol-disulfide isomerase/thioredoxin